jgi:hypothetical protein
VGWLWPLHVLTMLVAILLKQTARQSRVRLIVQGRSIQHVRRNRCSSSAVGGLGLYQEHAMNVTSTTVQLFAIIHAHHHRKDPSRKTSQASGNWYQTRSMRHEISRRGVDQIVLFPRCFNAKANSSNLAGEEARPARQPAVYPLAVACRIASCSLLHCMNEHVQ